MCYLYQSKEKVIFLSVQTTVRLICKSCGRKTHREDDDDDSDSDSDVNMNQDEEKGETREYHDLM